MRAIFLDYGTDALCLPYARALATLLCAELVIGYAPPEGESMSDEEVMATCARISQVSGEHVNVRVWWRGSIDWPEAEAIIVSNHLQSHARVPVWRPSHETGIRNAKAPILIPFSNKPKLERGYLWGISLAEKLGVPVIFYHTTWSKDGVTSERGEDHWHSGAQEVARRAQVYAREIGVPSELVVELASSVREGIHQMALSRCVTCIVAQQDANIVAGGYHDELIRCGHLAPLVILPKGGS